MIDIKRYSVKIAGASGMGIDSAGKILARVLKDSGYYVFAYREYPSLIKGGHSSYQIDVSESPINASSQYADLTICLERASVHAYLSTVRKGGTLVHNLSRIVFSEEEKRLIELQQIHIEFIDSHPIMEELGGLIFTNIFFLGMLCQLMGLDTEILKELVKEEFADKPKLLELDLKAIELGCGHHLPNIESNQIKMEKRLDGKTSLLLTGNEAISLGVISGGVRAYIAYPMTPASTILGYLANTYHETGILIKQAEDEITAAQMALGGMFAGTRSITGTSGGGFDLMTETISLAGVSETPFLCILAQRQGPGTGVPTWTSSSDLNLAMYGGHGEIPRYIIAASDAEDAYLVIQKGLNIAERYQMPVFVLTEKQIAESLFNPTKLPEALKIERGLVQDYELADLKPDDRFAITENGISKRWLPGQSSSTYLGNSDEHLPDGTMTEEALPVTNMVNKRMRKLKTLKNELPEPKLYGNEKAKTIFVGWGSVKNTVLDVMSLVEEDKVAYLHYESLWPLKTEKIESLRGQNLVLIETNYLGQLGNLIQQELGMIFSDRLLKYNGRPFFIEDILEYLEK